jgi:excisionase family DNA binding protein
VTERLLTTRDVGERLGIAPDTVLRWVRERGLPAIRLSNRAIRFRPDALEHWLTQRSTADTGDRGCQTPGAVPATCHPSRARMAAVGFGSSDAQPLVAATTEEDFHAR